VVVVFGGVCIGVLGGIGPEATGIFYRQFIEKLQNKGIIRKNCDFPQIIINSVPAPELIYDTITDEDIQPYHDGLQELDSFNADFIVMVCNTIHLFHKELQSKLNSPILDLREELKRILIQKDIESVLILGTPLTIKRELYKFEGIQCYTPTEEEMSMLSDAIFSFNRGINKDEQVKKVSVICRKYLDQGAQKVILGCTEFAAMLENTELPTINTIDVLVDATVNKFLEKKKFL